ncbi:MAG TPA: MotA/TolQ/ExbB proton channel family protein [Burkholderiales bacterium]|nr:MotA/TolQ/ExbB proton channel family protein [Burkholderiales bacterium]
MVEKLVHLSVQSGGLLPLMGLLLLVALTVIVERLYFYHRVLKSGMAMEHDLQLVEYQNIDKLQKLAGHYEGSMQRSIISSALASRGGDADTMERHIDEAIMWQMPKIDKHVWVLDSSVTLAPLMGLLGTIIGMVHAFGILGSTGVGGAAAQMVTGGIAEALVATGVGLLIAILAVAFLNYFNKRARLALHQMEQLKVMVINRLHGGGSAHHGMPVREAHSGKVTPISAGRR